VNDVYGRQKVLEVLLLGKSSGLGLDSEEGLFSRSLDSGASLLNLDESIDSSTKLLIDRVEVLADLLVDDVVDLEQAVGQVVAQVVVLLGLHDSDELSAGLVVIGIASLTRVIVEISRSVHSHGRFGNDLGIGLRSVVRVGPVVRKVVGDVDVHVTSEVGGVDHGRISGSVDGQLLEVVSDSMVLGVIVPVESALEKLVGRISDSGNDAGG